MNTKLYFLIAWIFILFGIAIRFYFQFISWTFNGDEINLGINIIEKSFRELLLPLERGQSAPPLFLLLMKFFSLFGKPELTLKILTFITSSLTLPLFYKIIKRKKEKIYLLALGLLCFSPFVITNSLTLKHYSFDLFFIVLGFIIINYKRSSYTLIIFSILFCLCSNIGPFFCLSSIILILNQANFSRFNRFHLRSILFLAVGPIVYFIYFIYFINQEGADELRAFMQDYWEEAFAPLNLDFIKWFLIRVKGLGFYFFTSYLLIDIFLLLISFIGIVANLIEKNKNEIIHKILKNYLIIISIHLVLSSLKLYPFSDRLYLYLAPFLYISLTKGILTCLNIFNSSLLKKKIKLKYRFHYISFILLIIMIYQIPYKDNDVKNTISEIRNYNDDIYITQKSKASISLWFELTKDRNVQKILEKSNILDIEVLPEKNAFILSRQQLKFGHQKETSLPEIEIQFLLSEKKIKLVQTFIGYKLYIFKP